jgi:nucleoside-diphosphate-sugar epimerase
MANILITGGAGFIGTHLVRAFMDAGHTVTSCDVSEKISGANFASKTETKDIYVLMKEIQSCEMLPSIYDQTEVFDTIFHLAATPRMSIGLDKPESVLTNNITPLIEVLGYCRRHPSTKLIFISSSSTVWADCSVNPYALSKKIGEQLVDTYINSFGVHACTARLFNVYGPGEADYGPATTLLKQCKKAICNYEPITINGNGSYVRDFTHVADIVTGLQTIRNEMMSYSNKAVYELGAGDDSVSVLQIAEAFGHDQINFGPPRGGEPARTKADRKLWPRQWAPVIKVLEYIEAWKEAGSKND